jgi:nucleoside-diphosphate-sugar epimerase
VELYLVTGGAGFIGSHLAQRLAKEGHRVRVLDNFSTGHRATVSRLAEVFGDRIEILEGDIRDPDRCRAAAEGCRAVFHQAALPSVPRSVTDPLTSHEVNATGTLNLLIAARDAGVGRFILAGSSSVYGDAPRLPKVEDMPPQTRSPYALGKLAGEEYARLFHELYGLSTVTLRYFNVFGPRQDPNSPYAAVIPLFIRALREGRPPTVFGDGTQSRDFTFIDNVVEANMAAVRARDANGPINVACGEQTTLLALLERLYGIIGRRIEPIFEPPRAGDVLHSRADITRARDLLQYRPAVDLEEGLRRTAAALEDSGP